MSVVWTTKRLFTNVWVVPVVLSRTGPQRRTAWSEKGIMVKDTLSDLITRIRNGYLAGKELVEVPSTRLSRQVIDVLVSDGYLAKVEGKEKLVVTLKYKGNSPAVTGIRIVSKPGARKYSGFLRLPKIRGGMGTNVLSTSKGVISGKQAKKMKVGGEIICQVW